MAVSEFSFDIVSRADAMEIKNALNQADKDLANRYDLKGTKCEILREKEDVVLVADDEFRMVQLKEIVFSKLIKRGIDGRQIEWGKIEPGAGISVRCDLKFQNGIEQSKAKGLIKQIKDKGLKVQVQIQGEELRVTSKSKDDLQKTMAFVKGLDLDFPVDFVNMR
ncbi:YajQ family cyclic di-GMP-binding protein [bacterium]|nr:MAG: YajQ family cyclic di-GMP-binding protein [bacterium]